MSEFEWIGGIAIAFVTLALAVCITLCGYFLLRKKYPHKKALNEVIVIGFAFFLAFCFRFSVCLFLDIEENGASELNGATWFLDALYQTISGISFEGLGVLDKDLEGTILECLYYGTAVYFGIVALIIITVGVSYEFFSYVKLFIFARHYNKMYIFTNVSQEGIILARSIVDKEEGTQNQLLKANRKNRQDSGNIFVKVKYLFKNFCIRFRRRNYAIVFIGNELEPFNKKNELHKKIENNGFYYWSYNKKKNIESEKSFLKILHYSERNVKNRDIGYDKNKIIHIFALKKNADLTGAEDKNSDIVFDDIKATLRDYKKKKRKEGEYYAKIPTVINYYILTNSDINYEFYRTSVAGIVDEFVGKNKGCAKGLEQKFQLHILNEAKLASVDMTNQLKNKLFWDNVKTFEDKKERKKLSVNERIDIASKIKNGFEQYEKCLKPNENEGVYRTAVFGFGQVGQYAMMELLSASSMYLGSSSKIKNGELVESSEDKGFLPVSKIKEIFENKVPSKFIADVYDKDMRGKSGEFAYTHPMFLCKTTEGEQTPEENEDLLKWERNEIWKVIIDSNKETLSDALKELNTQNEKFIEAIKKQLEEYKIENLEDELRKFLDQNKKLIDTLYEQLEKYEIEKFVDALKELYNQNKKFVEARCKELDSKNKECVEDIYKELDSKNKEFVEDIYKELEKWVMEIFGDALKELYVMNKKFIEARYKDPNQYEEILDIIIEQNSLPIIAMHNDSCMNQDFMTNVDKWIGIKDSKYKAFVVSLGNDEDNIKMGNMLIDDFKHELLLIKLKGSNFGSLYDPIVVFVNIRDENNLDRLNWSKKDIEEFSRLGLVVIPFGCRQDIWSYDNIVGDFTDRLFNYVYSMIYNYNNCGGAGNLSKENSECYMISKRKKRDEKSLSQDIVKDEISFARCNEKWLETTPFKQLSNREANRFSNNFYMWTNKEFDCTCRYEDKDFNMMEHLRWMRFHMSNGWIYAKYNKTQRKQMPLRENKVHNCLCPYFMLDDETQENDAINVDIGKEKEIWFYDQQWQGAQKQKNNVKDTSQDVQQQQKVEQ